MMKIVSDILKAAENRGIDPYTQPFTPKDLGLKASDYGSFSDYCRETTSSKWNRNVVLKVAQWRKGKPHKYLLLLNEQTPIASHEASVAAKDTKTAEKQDDSNHAPESPALTQQVNEQISLPEIIDIQEVQRIDSTISRLIRDTKQATSIKKLYGYACQVCGVILQNPHGPYAEGAHIVPLGKPFNGSDTVDNILCLCPNHHVLFDHRAFSIDDSYLLVGMFGKLNVHPKHNINKSYLKHHRDRNFKQMHKKPNP